MAVERSGDLPPPYKAVQITAQRRRFRHSSRMPPRCQAMLAKMAETFSQHDLFIELRAIVIVRSEATQLAASLWQNTIFAKQIARRGKADGHMDVAFILGWMAHCRAVQRDQNGLLAATA